MAPQKDHKLTERQFERIARVALFLASDQSGWLTGERISASGGFR